MPDQPMSDERLTWIEVRLDPDDPWDCMIRKLISEVRRLRADNASLCRARRGQVAVVAAFTPDLEAKLETLWAERAARRQAEGGDD